MLDDIVVLGRWGNKRKEIIEVNVSKDKLLPLAWQD